MLTLREKCRNSKFVWSVFSRIRTEYEDWQNKYPYSLRMLENTDQKNSKFEHFLRSLRDLVSFFWLLQKFTIRSLSTKTTGAQRQTSFFQDVSKHSVCNELCSFMVSSNFATNFLLIFIWEFQSAAFCFSSLLLLKTCSYGSV